MVDLIVNVQQLMHIQYDHQQEDFFSLRHRVFALLFSNLTRKARETRRVLSIAVFASFALLHIQLTITEITGFLDSAPSRLCVLFLI